MKYMQVLTVTGSGYFPLDMLRYDRASPHRQEDVGLIDVTNKERRSVQLVRFVERKDSEPTFGRWKSFGWDCQVLETRKFT